MRLIRFVAACFIVLSSLSGCKSTTEPEKGIPADEPDQILENPIAILKYWQYDRDKWVIELWSESSALSKELITLQVPSVSRLSWRPDGKLLYYRQYQEGEHTLMGYLLESGKDTLILDSDELNPSLVISPDNKYRVSFTGHEINISRMDSAYSYNIPVSGMDIGNFVWSPDGNKIIYSDDLHPAQLFMLDIHSREIKRVSGLDHYHSYNASWAPDSKSIVYLVEEERTDQHSILYYYLFSHKLRKAFLRDKTYKRTLSWSPNGEYIAYIQYDYIDLIAYSTVWLVNQDGTKTKKIAELTGDVDKFQWTPDSKKLVLSMGQAFTPKVFILDVYSKEYRRLTKNSSDTYETDFAIWPG